MQMRYAGIDIGSRSIELMVMDERRNIVASNQEANEKGLVDYHSNHLGTNV